MFQPGAIPSKRAGLFFLKQQKMIKREVAKKYAPQFAEAKKAYMERKGYVIGKGFSKSPEYRKIRRREVSANYRAKKKELLQSLEAKPVKAGAKGAIVDIIAPTNIFFLESDGKTQTAVWDAAKDAAKNQNYKLLGLVVSKLSNNPYRKSSDSKMAFDMDVRQGHRDAADWQRVNNDYPYVETAIITDDANRAIIVRVTFTEP